MAAWRDMTDDQYDADEAYGEYVRVDAFYDDWYVGPAAVERSLRILCDAIDEVVALLPAEGSSPGSSPGAAGSAAQSSPLAGPPDFPGAA